MARLRHQETFVTEVAPDAVRERALAWFGGYQHKMTEEGPGYFDMETGSKLKIWLFGGRWIAASSLPAKTRVTIREHGAGSEVIVVAQDAVFGTKYGMRDIYRGWLETIGAGVRDACT